MKKFLLLLLMMLILSPFGFCEGFPPKGGRNQYPIFWYLQRHADRLKKELDTRKFFRLHGWSCMYLVRITRNGDVIPLEVIYSKNKYYSNQVKKIISTVKAEPFGDEIDLDEMIIEIILGYSDVGDVVTILQSRAEKTYGRYTIFVLTTR